MSHVSKSILVFALLMGTQAALAASAPSSAKQVSEDIEAAQMELDESAAQAAARLKEMREAHEITLKQASEDDQAIQVAAPEQAVASSRNNNELTFDNLYQPPVIETEPTSQNEISAEEEIKSFANSYALEQEIKIQADLLEAAPEDLNESEPQAFDSHSRLEETVASQLSRSPSSSQPE